MYSNSLYSTLLPTPRPSSYFSDTPPPVTFSAYISRLLDTWLAWHVVLNNAKYAPTSLVLHIAQLYLLGT